ncbi:MAG TPA: hypothetical protein VFW33_15355 [Gemmataceae bacterium]|nr:hypothetical protein [Gemmataceae bacterium]
MLPLPPETVRFLQSLPWLGNVREMGNALEHAPIVARGAPLLPEHFPTFGVSPGATTPAEQLAAAVRQWLAERMKAAGGDAPAELYAELLRGIEPPLFDEVMRRVRGYRWVVVKWLGLNRATVRKKLGLYGLTDAHWPQHPGSGSEKPALTENYPLYFRWIQSHARVGHSPASASDFGRRTGSAPTMTSRRSSRTA